MKSQLSPSDPRVPYVAVVAEAVASLAVAVWLGGLLALGAFAAPVVFGELERETAGSVMGPIFGRFDRMVFVLVIVIAVAEVVRAVSSRAWGRVELVRLVLAVLLVAAGSISSLWFTPEINAMFEAGVRRGVGEQGMYMDCLHDWAETLGKGAIVCAATWLVLGVVARARRPVRIPATPSGSAAVSS